MSREREILDDMFGSRNRANRANDGEPFFMATLREAEEQQQSHTGAKVAGGIIGSVLGFVLGGGFKSTFGQGKD